MADIRGITVACESILTLLEEQAAQVDFGEELQFKVFSTSDFSDPIKTGVSLFLYRIRQNGNHRAVPGRLLPDGTRQKNRLPLNLYFFLTAWAGEASLQNTIAGWMMRVLEDSPVVPHRYLDHTWDGVFDADETIEVVLDELSNDELFNIWEQLAKNSYQLSVPYVARTIHIESLTSRTEAGEVLSRTMSYYRLDKSGET